MCDAENGDVAIVIVLFRPDADALSHLRQEAALGRPVIAVSNGVTSAQLGELQAMRGVTLVDNGGNVGLARALNQGIEQFLSTEARFVLLLDQDSRIPRDMIALLRQKADALQSQGVRIGCVAPRLVDKKSPLASVGATGEPQTVATSGSLLTREAIREVGPMWDELFIDGIDHEWCFRARSKGFAIVVDSCATLAHDMGDAGVRIGNRFRPIHRSPVRHYHIVRNTLWLQRCGYIPLRWRARELLKLSYRIPIYTFVSRHRVSTLRFLARALWHGLGRAPRLPVAAA